MPLSALTTMGSDVFGRLASARPITPPSTVLTPTRLGERGDEGENLWLLWEAAAPFLTLARGGAQVTDAEREEWAGWLAWAISFLDRWDGATEGDDQAFRAAVILLDLSQREDPGWQGLPQSLADNVHLRDLIAEEITRLAGRVMAVDEYGPSLCAIRLDLPTPQEGEGWAELVNVTDRLQVIAPGLFRALVRLQFRLWPASFAVQVSKWTDALAATALAQELGAGRAFSLSADSGNPVLGFAAICAHGKMRTPLEADAQETLERLLATVASHPLVWRGWMVALNRYPQRYPRLQASLGRALANASEEAFQIWLAALELYPVRLEDALGPEEPGEGAGACLAAFAETADISTRTAAWRAVWRCWNAWDFAGRGGLTTVCGSDIDLGVVGYAREVLDATELDAAIEAEAASLEALFAQRWTTPMELETALNRVQSRLQPLAHACELRRTSGTGRPAAVRYAVSDPDLQWRLKRAGCG